MSRRNQGHAAQDEDGPTNYRAQRQQGQQEVVPHESPERQRRLVLAVRLAVDRDPVVGFPRHLHHPDARLRITIGGQALGLPTFGDRGWGSPVGPGDADRQGRHRRVVVKAFGTQRDVDRPGRQVHRGRAGNRRLAVRIVVDQKRKHDRDAKHEDRETRHQQRLDERGDTAPRHHVEYDPSTFALMTPCTPSTRFLRRS